MTTIQNDIQIILPRNDNVKDDDKIIIHYKGEDIYHLTYVNGHNTTTEKTRHRIVLSGEELDVYMEALFTMLPLDRIPFKGIEFHILCFPCVRYEIKDLEKESLQDILMKIMPLLRQCEKL